MTATTADRNTPLKDGEILAVPVAANTVIRAGVIVCADANGNAVEGATATLNLSKQREERESPLYKLSTFNFHYHRYQYIKEYV